MPKALFISYYFPPCGAGWVMRVVNFIRYLPRYGWKSIVLTVKEDYYKENMVPDSSLLEDLPPDLPVVRTDSLEPKRKLKPEPSPGEAAGPSLLGRLIGWLEKAVFIPDVKILWLPIALRRGKQIIKTQGVDLIFVSVPDFSLLLIGYYLKRSTDCPLVLDLRDDWVGNPFYHQPYWYARKLVRHWEKKVVAAADKVVLVTERSREGFRRRYPEQDPEKFAFLPNGYDPQIGKILDATEPSPEFTLIHSGYLPPERLTPALFEALKELLEEQPALETKIRLVFRGNVCARARQLVQELGLAQQVQFAGSLPYQESIKELAAASVLLLIPSLNIPNSIPGKLYEYLALKRPLLVLAEDNATRDLLQEQNYGQMLYPDDRQGIRQAIVGFYRQFQQGKLKKWPAFPGLEAYNRAEQTRQLANIFNQVLEHV